MKFLLIYLLYINNTMEFSEGMMVLVKSDKNKKWWPALKWQSTEFIKALKPGTMKSMGYPTPEEKTEPFMHDTCQYRFIIKNDWGPCFIENITTKKIREIIYFNINSADATITDVNKLSKINFTT